MYNCTCFHLQDLREFEIVLGTFNSCIDQLKLRNEFKFNKEIASQSYNFNGTRMARNGEIISELRTHCSRIVQKKRIEYCIKIAQIYSRSRNSQMLVFRKVLSTKEAMNTLAMYTLQSKYCKASL